MISSCTQQTFHEYQLHADNCYRSWRYIIEEKPIISYSHKTFVVVQLLSCIRLFVTQWTAAHQAPLSFIISWSLLTFMSIELVMLSNHPILCCPLYLLPSVFPSIRVFSNKSAFHIRWPKHKSFQCIFRVDFP